MVPFETYKPNAVPTLSMATVSADPLMSFGKPDLLNRPQPQQTSISPTSLKQIEIQTTFKQLNKS